ncbi:hypothetical protein [Cellvibrio sp. pealriver]|uniref:hypothetical protein n=1 Tax=Cellvibrio sp. pealriver TaxID=1622269 RepID=UPI00066FB673|nr:hypothetical protein [Cellvibrio sp. pealriver]
MGSPQKINEWNFTCWRARLWVVLVLMPYTSALVTGEPSGQLTGTANRGKTGGGLEAIGMVYSAAH